VAVHYSLIEVVKQQDKVTQEAIDVACLSKLWCLQKLFEDKTNCNSCSDSFVLLLLFVMSCTYCIDANVNLLCCVMG